MENNQNGRKKGGYILLAIFIAAAIWFFVDEYGNNGGPYLQEKTIENIPVEYRYENILLDRNLMVQEEGTTSTVDLTLEGGRRLLARLDRSDIQVTVDLSVIAAPGVQNLNYKVTFSNNRFNNLTRKSNSPSYATVNISELNKKTVDIRCELVGTVAPGYSAGALQLDQTTIDIRGLNADIEAISYAKVVLDIGEDAMETVTHELTCQFYDRNDRLVDVSAIHPSAKSVQATLPINVTKDLTLTVNILESAGLRKDNMNIKIEPAVITVSGDARQLRDVESLSVGELDLLTVPRTGISSHTFSLSIPEEWQNVNNATRATITVSFRDMASAKIPVKKITFINQPEEKDIHLLTSEVVVTVYGKSADVDAITAERLSLTADFRDFSSAIGTYTIPVSAEIVSGKDVGISGSYQIKVDIQTLEPLPEPETDLTEST